MASTGEEESQAVEDKLLAELFLAEHILGKGGLLALKLADFFLDALDKGNKGRTLTLSAGGEENTAVKSAVITRRQALGLSAGALLSLGLWPGRTEEPGEGWFRFLVVNDTHYMSPECGAWLRKAIERMQSHAGVEFCLIAGDLTEHGTAEHLAAVRDVFKELGMPVYVQPGNHDYAGETDRRSYEAIFPSRLNYGFEHRGWQFLGLDSTEGQKYQKTNIQPATLDWLDTELPRLVPRRPTVVFTHFPLGAEVTYRPLNADAVLHRFLRFNLKAVFSGHFHGYTHRHYRGTELTTNKCCALKRANHDSSKEKGYFLCTAHEGTLSRQFIQI